MSVLASAPSQPWSMPDAVEHSALLLVTDVGGEGGNCGAVSRSSAEVRPANSDRHPTSTCLARVGEVYGCTPTRVWTLPGLSK